MQSKMVQVPAEPGSMEEMCGCGLPSERGLLRGARAKARARGSHHHEVAPSLARPS